MPVKKSWSFFSLFKKSPIIRTKNKHIIKFYWRFRNKNTTLEDLDEYLGRRRPEEDGTGVLGISRRQSELLCGVAGDSDAASEILTAEDCPGESSDGLLGTIRHIFIWNANLAFLHLLPIDFPFPTSNISLNHLQHTKTRTHTHTNNLTNSPLQWVRRRGPKMQIFQVGLDLRRLSCNYFFCPSAFSFAVLSLTHSHTVGKAEPFFPPISVLGFGWWCCVEY